MPSRVFRRTAPDAALLAALLAGAATAHPQAQSTAQPASDAVKVYYDTVDEHGALIGGVHMLPREQLGRQLNLIPQAEVTMVLESQGVGANGDNRFDLVFVGDGYAASRPTLAETTLLPPDDQLPPMTPDLVRYEGHVAGALYRLFQMEPFRRYKPAFRSYRVDVRSDVSGVSGDPVASVVRDTPLNMRFWCDDIERLLCVDTFAAEQFADQAPFVDLIIAVANSNKYGGSGYQSQNILTVSGGSPTAFAITAHEIGHVLGILADEYTVDGFFEWEGGEPGEANISTFTAAEMIAQNGKWASWIGHDIVGFDGPVSTYEGGGYYAFDIYRPSPDSAMKTIGRPFNVVGVERLVVGIYTRVDTIDAVSPVSVVAQPNTVFTVEPLPVVGQPLSVQWLLDGLPLSVPEAHTLDLSTITLSPGTHLVTVRVVDNTPYVRNQAYRDQWLTNTRDWVVEVPGAAPDEPSLAKAASTLRQWGEQGADLDGDHNGDGRVDLRDLLRALGSQN